MYHKPLMLPYHTDKVIDILLIVYAEPYQYLHVVIFYVNATSRRAKESKTGSRLC